MKLSFYGATGSVTGSSYLLQTKDQNVLIDCGLFQGNKTLEKKNREPFAFSPKTVDFMLLTHAHIDHTGMIPRLAREGFSGKIYTTKATYNLSKIMLPDAAHIQQEEIKWHNRKRKRAGKLPLEPLYTTEDAEHALSLFEPIDYNDLIEIAPGFKVRFVDAGHILGSAIIEVFTNGEKIVFSGDIGNSGQAIVKDPTPINEADYVLIESTYGDRFHKDRDQTVKEFRQILRDCLHKGGNIIIPAFAVERTQEIIYEISRMCEEEECPNIPIYVDSPMAVNATEVFQKHPECYDDETYKILRSGKNPLNLKNLHLSKTVEQSRAINEKDRAIIISASGMAHAGRILHHLKHNLWREESHVIFVGYQAHGTLGRRILEGAKTVKIFGEEIAVKASIHTLGGFSAHADQNGLIGWLSHFDKKPKKVFIVHGEDDSRQALKARAESELGLNMYIPSFQETIEI